MISVIVCAFNEQKIIRQCLKSLREQKLPKKDYEVVIIDDESNDETPNIVARFINSLNTDDACFRFYRIEHGGLSVARNTGIKKSKGEIVCFIDGDAIANEDWLAQYLNTFKNTGCDYSSGSVRLLNTGDHFARVLQDTRFRQSFIRPFTNHFHGVNMAFKRIVFKKYPGFYENFDSRGDDVSFRNIIAKNFKYCPCPKAIVVHERPESFNSWFKVYKKELKLQYLVNKAIFNEGSGSRYPIPILKSISVIASIIIGFLYPVFFVIGFLLFLFSKRNVLFRPYQSLSSWLFVLTSSLIDTLLKPFYYLWSYFMYNKESLILPHSTNTSVLKELSNHPE